MITSANTCCESYLTKGVHTLENYAILCEECDVRWLDYLIDQWNQQIIMNYVR